MKILSPGVDLSKDEFITNAVDLSILPRRLVGGDVSTDADGDDELQKLDCAWNIPLRQFLESIGMAGGV